MFFFVFLSFIHSPFEGSIILSSLFTLRSSYLQSRTSFSLGG